MTTRALQRLVDAQAAPAVLLARRNAELAAEASAAKDFEGAVRRAVARWSVHGSTAALTCIRAAIVELDARRAFQRDETTEKS